MTLSETKDIMNAIRASRGVSGALYLQSAIAEVMFCFGSIICEAARCMRR